MSARSLLYVPGNKPDLFAKGMASGADAIILDLEDAVPFEQKDFARETVAAWLGTNDGQAETWVRINSGGLMERDVAAIAPAGPAGLYVPKVSSPHDLALAGKAGLPLTALIETAAGVLDVRAIASHPRVVRLAIGEADLSSELGLRPSADEREMLPMRMHVVLASAAAALEAPVGSVVTDFRDDDALRTSSEALLRMGFGGRSAIHPAQVAIINHVFTPSADDVAKAQRLLELFEQAGRGVCIDDDGRMVDEAIARAARRTLRIANRVAGRQE